MNDKQYERKVEKDAAKVKKNLGSIFGNSVDHFGEKVEKFAEDAKEVYDNKTASVKKDVAHGLDQYNAKAQEYAEKVSGDLADKAGEYPWVAITIGLVLGVFLGGLLKPSRR